MHVLSLPDVPDENFLRLLKAIREFPKYGTALHPALGASRRIVRRPSLERPVLVR